MPAIDFPNSPTVGQTFTVGTKTWIWDGSTWGSTVPRPPVRIASDTAPVSPIANDEWFDSSTGKSYIYYDSYWVEMNSSAQGQPGVYTVSDTAPTSPVSGTTWFNSSNGKQYIYNGSVWVEPNSNLAGPTGAQGPQGFTGNKNFILNGGFDIAQRGTVSFVGGGYSLDRWYLSSWGSASATSVSQQTTGVPVGSRYCMRVTYGASGGYGNMFHFMDTATTSQLWGKTVTLSAKVRRSSSWTLSSFLSVTVSKTATVDGGPSATFTALFPSPIITQAQMPTGTTSSDWYTFTTTFTVPNDGTANGLAVQFSEQAVGSAGAYYEVAQVQLEVGTVATEFARNSPTIAEELASCQRYYVRFSGTNPYNSLGLGMVNSTTAGIIQTVLPVSMRVTPTSVEFSTLGVQDNVAGGVIAVTGMTVGGSSPNIANTDVTVSSGLTSLRPMRLLTNNSASGFLGFSAELA